MVQVRRVLTASILALTAFGLMLAGTGAAHAQDQAGGLDGVFTAAPSRAGDRALYALHMVRIEEGEKGGWAYDAGARLEVERHADRVIPVDGTPQAVSSFSSTWVTREIDWGDWLVDWQLDAAMSQMQARMQDMPDYSDYDGAMDEGDWEQYANDMEQYGEDMGEWGAALGEIFANLWDLSPRIVGEPWHVAHVDSLDRVVATTRAGSDDAFPGRQLADDLGLEPQTTVITTFGTSSAPCGFRSDLQGNVVDLSRVVRIKGDCPPAGGHFGTPADNLTSDRFLAVGHDVVQGRPAVVFAHEDGANNLRVWYAEDVPYPVRMVVPVLVFDDYYVHLLYELTEFQQGTLAGAEAPSAPLLAPRTPAGPDATDVEHDFPLAAALQAATADKENTAVAQWMAEHPDAAIDEATFLRVREHDGSLPDQLRWSFTLVSGGDALHVTATKGAPYQGPTNTWPNGVPPVPPGLIPPEGQDAERLIDDGVLVESEEASSAGRISPGQMPATMPRVADVLDLWRRDGAGGGVAAWSFQLRPDGSSWMAVGVAEATVETSNDGDQVVQSLQYSFYGVRPDGSFLFVEEAPARYEVPPQDDPDSRANADPEHDEDFSDPDGFALASLGYWTFPETKTTATITAAAGLVGLLAYALLPAKFGALGLFSRIGSDQVLEHPLRQQITDLVTAEPGIHFQELVRRLDAGRGTMEHHLRKLVAADVLTMQVSQGFTCFFPKGKVDRHLMAAAPVLKSDGARQVLQCIQEQPGRAALDVATATGLTPSTVNYHLKRLVASGLVSHERRGRFILLTPTPLGTQALGAWGRN